MMPPNDFLIVRIIPTNYSYRNIINVFFAGQTKNDGKLRQNFLNFFGTLKNEKRVAEKRDFVVFLRFKILQFA